MNRASPAARRSERSTGGRRRENPGLGEVVSGEPGLPKPAGEPGRALGVPPGRLAQLATLAPRQLVGIEPLRELELVDEHEEAGGATGDERRPGDARQRAAGEPELRVRLCHDRDQTSRSTTARPSATRVAATRVGALGVVGPAHDLGERLGRDGPAASASTRRPRPWRSLPSKRDCGAGDARRADDRIGLGEAGGRPRAAGVRAAGRRRSGVALRADGAPRSNTAWPHRHPSPGGTAASATACASRASAAGRRGRGRRSARRWCRRGRCRPRRRRPARPGPCTARCRAGRAARRGAGQRAAVALDDRGGAAVQVDGAAVVAEPLPTRRTTSPTGAAAHAAGVGKRSRKAS